MIKARSVQIEERQIVHARRGYRVTGSPSIDADHHAMVEVFIAGAQGWHWRRLRHGPTKAAVLAAARSGRARQFSVLAGKEQFDDVERAAQPLHGGRLSRTTPRSGAQRGER